MLCRPSLTHDSEDANLDLAARIRCQTAGRARSTPHEARQHVVIPETIVGLSTGGWLNVTERPRRPHFVTPFRIFLDVLRTGTDISNPAPISAVDRSRTCSKMRGDFRCFEAIQKERSY